VNQSPTSPGLDFDAMLSWAIVIGLSIWAGVVSFMRKLNEGQSRPFNIRELIGEVTVSGFTGVLTAYLCAAVGVHGPMQFALAGIAAHMGSRWLFKLEAVLNRKFDLPADPAPAKEPTDAAH
jgi:hypothetical protein